jgi:hypothetical protein
MEKKSDKSSWLLIGYFVLGLFFALLSIVAKRPMAIGYERLGASVGIDTRWLFWLLLSLSAACMVPLITAILRILHTQKKLPKFLDSFYLAEFESEQSRIREKLFGWFLGRAGMLALTGAAILLMGLFIARTNALDDDNVNGNLYDLILRLRGVERANLNFTHVTQLLYLTPSKDPDQHLRDLRDIVVKLKSAGARTVVISLPQFPPDGRNVIPLIKEICSSEIVVWGMSYGTMNQPVTQIAESLGATTLSLARYSTSMNELWRGPSLVRLWRADAALTILGEYHNYPRYMNYQPPSKDEIDFGNYKVPLSKGQWTYALDKYEVSALERICIHRGDAWISGGMVWGGMPIQSQRTSRYLGSMKETDTLQYSAYNRTPERKSLWAPLEKGALEENVKNKIVLLVGNYGSQWGHYMPDRAIAVWLESVLRGELMRKPPSGHLWVSIACLVIAGFFSYRFRPLMAILLMFVVAAITLVAASHLYNSMNVIIDIFYPLLSIGVAMIVFPAIAAMHRRYEGMVPNE